MKKKTLLSIVICVVWIATGVAQSSEEKAINKVETLDTLIAML